MADPTLDRYRGLILSATELRELNPEWSDRQIEDYLELLSFIFELADEVDVKNDIIKATTVVTFADTPYTPLPTDEEIAVDTTAGIVDITLPPGIKGTNYRIGNVGEVGNDANIIPALTNKLFGVAATEPLKDGEVFLITFFEVLEDWN